MQEVLPTLGLGRRSAVRVLAQVGDRSASGAGLQRQLRIVLAKVKVAVSCESCPRVYRGCDKRRVRSVLEEQGRRSVSSERCAGPARFRGLCPAAGVQEVPGTPLCIGLSSSATPGSFGIRIPGLGITLVGWIPSAYTISTVNKVHGPHPSELQ